MPAVDLPISESLRPARRILVVDDSQAGLFVLGRLLETMGHQVRTASTAAEALQHAKAERPEVVISDIGMPGMDGYELARRLREEPALKDVLLVALTGYAQESDRSKALDAGFDCHLVKPVSMQSLQELLQRVPARWRAPQSVRM
ncbi:MAG: response regulator [Planctomycetia bacterium]|nr:response regulator [Planctomycetia bacterium]